MSVLLIKVLLVVVLHELQALRNNADKVVGQAGTIYPGPDGIAHVFVFLGSIICQFTN